MTSDARALAIAHDLKLREVVSLADVEMGRKISDDMATGLSARHLIDGGADGRPVVTDLGLRVLAAANAIEREGAAPLL